MTDCAIEFPGMVEKYYHSWFRFHPFEAIHAGLNLVDNSLPPITDEDQGALAALFLKVRCCMEENGSDRLTHEQQIDFKLMRNSVQLEHRKLLKADWRQQNPLKYLPNQTLQYLICDQAHHETMLIQRLQALPSYLSEAKQQLSHHPKKVPEFWQQQGILQSEREALRLSLFAQEDIAPHVKESAIEASAALTDYAAFLNALKQCEGKIADGAEFFHLNLSLKHFIDIEPQQLTPLLKAIASEAKSRLPSGHEQLCADFSNQPNSGNAFSTIVQLYHTLYKKLKTKQLFPLPDESKLRIAEMPSYLASTAPLCFYQHVATPSQDGLLYIQGSATHFHPALLECLCAEKLWPGEHLYTVEAHKNAEKSIPRLLNTSPALTLSWSLYCFEILLEKNFFEYKESTLIIHNHLYKYAQLALIDQQFHCEDITLDQASSTISELWLSQLEQDALLLRITQYPGEFTAAILGQRILHELRSQLSSDNSVQLSQLHQQLLSKGPVALPILIQQIWGEPLWKAINQSLFGSN